MQNKLDRILTASAAAGLGAGLAYLLDARNGRRRRARLRDRGFHLFRRSGRAVRSEAAYLAGRCLGLANLIRNQLQSRLRKNQTGKADDSILRDKVRSRIGHSVSHAHALDVEVRGGIVTMHGPVPAGEIAGLIDQVRRIPGVRSVAPIPSR